MAPILTLTNVSHSYHEISGEIKALDTVNFTVNPGEFIALVGPSGCGKSTILSMIAGLILPSEGQIYIKNKPVTSNQTPVGYMLQKDHLFEWRTILSNVLLGLEIQDRLNDTAIKHAKELLSTYGLEQFAHVRPSQLSGGMRQRAALIRTLVLDPEILLLDEPFSALDYQTRISVADDIYKIIKNENKTAILVTHDLSEAISMADRILILSARPGHIVKEVPVIFHDLSEATPMQKRNASDFKTYFNLIWKELDGYE